MSNNISDSLACFGLPVRLFPNKNKSVKIKELYKISIYQLPLHTLDKPNLFPFLSYKLNNKADMDGVLCCPKINLHYILS